MSVIEGLYYTEDHEWLRVEGDKAYVGITDYAQHTLGDIAYVGLPEVGTDYEAGSSFGVVESVKMASDINIPVSGSVLEVNTALEDDPGLINQDAYENWIAIISVKNPDELANLKDAAAYAALTDGQ
jgi:glycine cleavage system H protein